MSNIRRVVEAANQIAPAPVRPARPSAHTPAPTPVKGGFDQVKDGWEGLPTKELKEDHGPENDYEGEMALTQLKTLEEKAAKIAEMLKPDSKLEAWVQSKITVAEDYISTVHDYLKNTPDSIG